MRELVIGREEAHQRLDKYIQKYFENASAGFLYKMIRKKNIVRNGKKVQGKEILCEGDVIRVFFSDETFAAMRGGERALGLYEKLAELEDKDVDVIYEDADILAVNKPAGILSQKAKDTDISMNEEILAWLIHRGKLTPENFALFHPSVANRLDRNTTGLLLAGKTLRGQQALSQQLRDRSLRKIYHCIVAGEVASGGHLAGYLWKDEQKNQVVVLAEQRPGAKYVETAYEPLAVGKGLSLLQVDLLTGRAHQIRAHLAAIGHPVIGDFKYGDRKLNEKYRRRFQVTSQLLHACEITLTDGTVITAPYPPVFQTVLRYLRES